MEVFLLENVVNQKYGFPSFKSLTCHENGIVKRFFMTLQHFIFITLIKKRCVLSEIQLMHVLL